MLPQLPNELCLLILQYLTLKDLKCVYRVNKNIYGLWNSNKSVQYYKLAEQEHTKLKLSIKLTMGSLSLLDACTDFHVFKTIIYSIDLHQLQLDKILKYARRKYINANNRRKLQGMSKK